MPINRMGDPSDFGSVYQRMPERKNRVRNFTELLELFEDWGNRPDKPVTNRQARALGIEAQKHGNQTGYVKKGLRIGDWIK